MRLSEAIMLGSTLSHQVFNRMHDSKGGRCALGAAYHAMGIDQYDKTVPDIWPWTYERAFCPECANPWPVFMLIAHCLNDGHRWSRERIADWVATVEPREEPASCTETVQASLETVSSQ